MMNYRVAAQLSIAVLLGAPSLPAIEVAAQTPERTVQTARQPVAAPLRVAEALSLAPLAALEPARTGDPADLAALADWNASGRKPTRVGFARELAEALELRYDAASFAARIGMRAGGGLLARRSNGDWVWGTSVAVPEAKALRLELTAVNLPAGTRLWAYGLGDAARAFDLRLLRDDGTLISPTIAGDRIYLEVELPAGEVVEGQGFFVRRVFEVAIGDEEGEEAEEEAVGALAAPEGDSCLQNGECFDAGDFPAIAAARQGVFRVLFEDDGFIVTCSGSLLNDLDPSTVQPWLLTAHHCIDNQSSALSMDTKFFWRYTGCGSGASTFTYGPLGADLIVTSATTDVTLARALDPAEVPDGATYLGWSSVRPADGTVLHRLSHPVLEATSVTQPQTYSTHQLDESPSFTCPGYSTTNFLYSLNLAGTGISPGSSGSPVMRGDGVIVGQLLGGCGAPADGCGTDENIVDGAFAASYPLLAPFIATTGPACIRDADTACLLDGRFKVEVSYQTSSTSGNAKVMSFNGERAESTEAAFFWFFNATNFEMGVKMVDACVAPYNRFWVFFSGLTSQGFQVTVTRMADGMQKVYPPNPVNHIPTTTADTDAFTCLETLN